MISSLLYANDIVLLAPDEESLHVQIKVVEEWYKRWRMSLNIVKTKVVHFRKKTRYNMRLEHCFLFNDEEIEYARQCKYLGLLYYQSILKGEKLLKKSIESESGAGTIEPQS